MFFTTLLSWFAWGVVVFYTNPESLSILGFLIFYLALFFSLIGTFALIGLELRIHFSYNEILFKHIAPSFRQAVLLSLIIVVTLFLQSQQLLNWWDGLLFAGAVGLLELYFVSR